MKVDDRRGAYSDNISSAEMSGAPEDTALPDLPLMISDPELQWTRFWTVYRFYFLRKSRDIGGLLIHIVVPLAIIVLLTVFFDGNRYNLVSICLSNYEIILRGIVHSNY